MAYRRIRLKNSQKSGFEKLLKASFMATLQWRYVCVNISFKSTYDVFESQELIQKNKD